MLDEEAGRWRKRKADPRGEMTPHYHKINGQLATVQELLRQCG